MALDDLTWLNWYLNPATATRLQQKRHRRLFSHDRDNHNRKNIITFLNHLIQPFRWSRLPEDYRKLSIVAERRTVNWRALFWLKVRLLFLKTQDRQQHIAKTTGSGLSHVLYHQVLAYPGPPTTPLPIIPRTLPRYLHSVVLRVIGLKSSPSPLIGHSLNHPLL